MPSNFETTLKAALWPALLPQFGETMTHQPQTAAAYTATLVYDDGQIVATKGGRVKAVISGPIASFTTAPAERDTFTRATGEQLVCVEVEDDKVGGWLCWCRLLSAA